MPLHRSPMTEALPKYRVIADTIAERIAAGRLKAGEQIPPERAIAEEFASSRMTVRQALRHLADRGLIETRVGQGTFVGTPVIQQQLSTLTGFTEEIERQGRTASSILVEAARQAPDAQTAQRLDLRPGADVWRITRVRMVDQEPVAIETTEVAADLAPGLLDRADFARESLYATLRTQYGVTPATAEQTLAATSADHSVALPLRLQPGAPVLRLTRLTRDTGGRAFEHVRSHYRGDAFEMKTTLSLGAG